ncbi:heme biosynthesis HemY N-terminal domain-containing protein [Bordetella sp. BOR01]|uniref:heme biosynthesis HemY N-terminal domain-containing protein n=1 Tax=Bordetella sp. BOR01 TaxID=2854779 RepID=UPI001C48366F|nr:heme biosynthesis HemY N-terminal domain-containing protein [Bordetella sp. BOR01]MBV7482473.1 protoheme IX synthesis protein [Bordetella sp. BOR01]
MRTWFWTLLLAVVAVALAVVLRTHAGNVMVLVWPWRIELSLTLTVLLVLALFVSLYVGLRVLAWLLAIPDRMRAWRGQRAQARDHELLERGWTGLLEGRYAHAEKDLTKLLEQTRVPSRRVLAALSAARAAHGLGEFERRDRLLDSAREHANGNAGLQEAIATVSADQLLDQGRAQDALTVLAPLQDGGVRHLHTMRLLLRAEAALGHHDRVFTLARGLLRRNALSKTEAEHLIDTAGAARLRAASTSGTDAWRPIWKDLKSDERVLPEIALAGATAFEAAGEPAEAARVLEAAVPVHFTSTLVAAYARCDADQVPRRLAKAEGWLQKRPADADLLAALGMLCLNGQLWGQAERYLQRSLGFRNDSHTHALLGSLYDRLDRPADAVRHWRLATAASMALPVLAADRALPAAEMAADPLHLDAEGEYSTYPPEASPPSDLRSYGADLPPQAVPADYVLDPDARRAGREASSAVQPEPPAVAPARSAVDIEDYFDSAPIPVAAFDVPVPTYGTPTPRSPDAAAESKPDDDNPNSLPNKQG